MSPLPLGRVVVVPGASFYDWLMFGHVLAAMIWLGGWAMLALGLAAHPPPAHRRDLGHDRQTLTRLDQPTWPLIRASSLSTGNLKGAEHAGRCRLVCIHANPTFVTQWLE